jgi:hypothetical protein
MHKLFEEELRQMVLGQPVESPIYTHLCSVDTDGQADWSTKPYGLDLVKDECGEDADCKEAEYLVTCPAWEGPTVVQVKVNHRHPTGAMDIFNRACMMNGLTKAQARAMDLELFVGGKFCHPAHEPMGLVVEARPRGRGGMMALVTGLAAPGLWAMKVVGAAAVEVGGAVVTERLVEDGAVVWVDANLPRALSRAVGPVVTPGGPEELVARPIQCVLVALDGKAKVVEVARGSSVAYVCEAALGLTARQLQMFEPGQDGRPCKWLDPVSLSGHVTLRAKGLGGASISRSEAVMSRIENRVGVLQTSRPALMHRLDPMHDNAQSLGGWPDAESANSVPMCFKTAAQVVSFQGSTSEWDCNMVWYPDSDVVNLTQVNRTTVGGVNYNECFSTTTNAGTAGGFCVYQGVSGTSLLQSTFTSGMSWAPNAQVTSSNQTYCTIQGAWRLVGLGMEVTNNTAPLYRQGQATAWSQPVAPASTATVLQLYDTTQTTGYFPGSASAVIAPAPPNSIAEANVLPGSRQWAAEKGAYFTARSSADSLPPLNGQTTLMVYYNDASNDSVLCMPNWRNATYTGGSTVQTTWPVTHLNPYNMMGLFCTGLSPQTTFTVNIWAFVEIFPEQLGNVLTPLGQPSAPYDEQALRLYSEIIKGMPVAVQVDENGFGDWLADLAGKAVNVVSGIASTVVRLGGAVKAGADAYNNSAPSSETLRGDGVKAQIAEERKERVAATKRLANRVAAVVPKASLALRNQMAMDKAKKRTQQAAAMRASRR